MKTITTWRLSYWHLKHDNLIYDNDSLSKKTKRDRIPKVNKREQRCTCTTSCV